MLLVVFGPPAVGKMTIGRAVCARTGFRLFHNHMTIEPLLETFGHGTPPFNRLNGEFRFRVLQEAAAHGVDLVLSLVWALDCAEDLAVLAEYVRIFGDEVAFVELRAPLEVRLARNRTEQRLLHKASKRDVEWSDANVRELEAQWQMTSAGGAQEAAVLLDAHPHLVLDTTSLTSDESANRIVTWLADLGRPTPAWSASRDVAVPDDVARLLATVPEWFGRPESNTEYVDAARAMETWTVRDAGRVVGVALVDRHFVHVAELHLMVVDRDWHGRGVGSALVGAIERDARRAGLRLLEVKTLGPSHPDAGYARTRHFYERSGFVAVEETELWGEDTPCLVMVKPLALGA